jgi:hypothetical protein
VDVGIWVIVASWTLFVSLTVESLACVDSDGIGVVVTVMRAESKVRTKVQELTLVSPVVGGTTVMSVTSELCAFAEVDWLLASGCEN